MEGESLLQVVLPKNTAEPLCYVGAQQGSGAAIEEGALMCSVQPLCCPARLWYLLKQAQHCPVLQLSQAGVWESS